MGKAKKIRVLFLCSGNTCRSPMAHYIFKDYLAKRRILNKYEVCSAGVFAQEGCGMTFNAIKALSNLEIKVKEHKAAQLTERLLKKSDIIVCMTLSHKNSIDEEYISKSYTIGEITNAEDVPDPYGFDVERYEAVANYLSYCCDDIYRIIREVISNENSNS